MSEHVAQHGLRVAAHRNDHRCGEGLDEHPQGADTERELRARGRAIAPGPIRMVRMQGQRVPKNGVRLQAQRVQLAPHDGGRGLRERQRASREARARIDPRNAALTQQALGREGDSGVPAALIAHGLAHQDQARIAIQMGAEARATARRRLGFQVVKAAGFPGVEQRPARSRQRVDQAFGEGCTAQGHEGRGEGGAEMAAAQPTGLENPMRALH